jgi:hypothetical protein
VGPNPSVVFLSLIEHCDCVPEMDSYFSPETTLYLAILAVLLFTLRRLVPGLGLASRALVKFCQLALSRATGADPTKLILKQLLFSYQKQLPPALQRALLAKLQEDLKGMPAIGAPSAYSSTTPLLPTSTTTTSPLLLLGNKAPTVLGPEELEEMGAKLNISPESMGRLHQALALNPTGVMAALDKWILENMPTVFAQAKEEQEKQEKQEKQLKKGQGGADTASSGAEKEKEQKEKEQKEQKEKQHLLQVASAEWVAWYATQPQEQANKLKDVLAKHVNAAVEELQAASAN